jgi:hypothetical protein
MTRPTFSTDFRVSAEDPNALDRALKQLNEVSRSLATLMRNGVTIQDNLNFYYYTSEVNSGTIVRIPSQDKKSPILGVIPVYTDNNAILSYTSTQKGIDMDVSITFSGTGKAKVRFLVLGE